MPHELDTGPASGLLEGSVLAQPSTQLTGGCVIERAPIKIELMGLDSRSSQTLSLTLLRGRQLQGPSLRAARSRGHRNFTATQFRAKRRRVATSSPIKRA